MPDPRPQPQPRPIRQYLALAASIAALAILGYFSWRLFLQPPSPPLPTAEIIELERPPQMTRLYRGGDAAASDSAANIGCITLFRSERQYQEALRCFQDLAARQATPEIEYYIAHSHFKLKAYETSISLYDQLLESGLISDQSILDQIRWNRLLAKILAGHEDYRQELQNMADEQGGFYYLSEAMSLQQLLESGH